MTPKRYRQKPVEVEAVQFMGGSASAAEIVRWINGNGGNAHYEPVYTDTVDWLLRIKTLEGQMHAVPKDYIIRGVRGEFYPCKPDIFLETYYETMVLSDANRKIIEEAYDDGDGNTVTLSPSDDPPWFVGTYQDWEIYLGMEHQGVLYSIVHASGGGSCAVITGRGLLDNELGITFLGVDEAKAYVKGLTAK